MEIPWKRKAFIGRKNRYSDESWLKVKYNLQNIK